MPRQDRATQIGEEGDIKVTMQRMQPRQGTSQTEPYPVTPEPYGPIVLRLPPAVQLTEEQLLELCGLNDELRIEINARGDLELMPPTSGNTSRRNSNLAIDLGIWARADGAGDTFDSNGGFILPSGALRSPDASWVLKSRLAELPEGAMDRFVPLCPDFVIELRSRSDRLPGLQSKMAEYLEHGARLGWLIDPVDPGRRVYVYRPGAPVEILEAPESLSGAPELTGFVLDLQPIWEPAL